jgi:AcrR family transcriptional regulator
VRGKQTALYYYFESKENCSSLLFRKMSFFENHISNCSKQKNSFEDMLVSAADAYLKFTSENQDFMRLYSL